MRIRSWKRCNTWSWGLWPVTPRIDVQTGDVGHKRSREGCPQLARTLPLMRANKLHPERIADGTRTVRDDYTIALSYFCRAGVYGQPKPKTSVIPRWMQPKSGDRDVLGSESVKRR